MRIVWLSAVITLALVVAMFAFGCGHGTPPDPNDPTAPPPAVTLPKDPLAPPFTPFYRHADGGTDR